MITIDKLNIYRKYKGYFDGYYSQNEELEKKYFTGEEWALLGNLLQDIYLVETNYANESFSRDLDRQLKEHCDSDETIIVLKELEKYLRS